MTVTDAIAALHTVLVNYGDLEFGAMDPNAEGIPIYNGKKTIMVMEIYIDQKNNMVICALCEKETPKPKLSLVKTQPTEPTRRKPK